MFCPKCGNLVPGDSRSCLYCGFSWEVNSLTKELAQFTESADRVNRETSLSVRKRFDERVQWLVSIFLFCITLAICFWLMFGSSGTLDSSETSNTTPAVSSSYYYIPELPQPDRPEVGQVALYDLARKDKEETAEENQENQENQESQENQENQESQENQLSASLQESTVPPVEEEQPPVQTAPLPSTTPDQDHSSEQNQESIPKSESPSQSMYYLSVESLYYTVDVDECIEIHLTHNCPGVAVFLINDAFGGPYGRYSQSYSYEDTSATFYITGSMPGDTLLTFYYKDPDGNIIYSPQVTVVVTQ